MNYKERYTIGALQAKHNKFEYVTKIIATMIAALIVVLLLGLPIFSSSIISLTHVK